MLYTGLVPATCNPNVILGTDPGDICAKLVNTFIRTSNMIYYCVLRIDGINCYVALIATQSMVINTAEQNAKLKRLTNAYSIR